MIAFLFYFAALGAVLCASTLVPALISYGFQETDVANRMLLYGGSGGFLCIATLLSIDGRLAGMERSTAIILAITSWLAFPIIVALPLTDLADLDYIDALFQMMSVFTTSGSVIFSNLETVPKGVLFLLAQFQWLGGLATLITLILVLAPWEVGGLPQVGSASVAASIVASHSRLVRFCWRILRAYLLLTLVCFVFLVLAGVSPYEGMILSLTALSTGGIVPPTESLDFLLGNSGMVIMAIFMVVGGTSIFWHEHLVEANVEEIRKHRESYFVLAFWLALAVLITNHLVQSGSDGPVFTDPAAISEGLFNAASIITTTGIQSRPGIFSLLPPLLVLLIVFVGAGCYSTSGGLKFFRIGAMFSLSEYELNRLIYPSSVKPSRFGSTRFDIETMKAIWSMFAVIIVTIGVATCLLSFSGMAFQPSFTAVIAAITNAGSIYTPDWATSASSQWPAYSDMRDTQKFLLTFIMFLGRLEVVAVVASVTLLLRRFR